MFQSHLGPLLATFGLTAFLLAAWLVVKDLFLALYVERSGSGGGQCTSYDYSRDQVSM